MAEHLRIPRHVAIIMDGNGRWAQARGLSRIRGHEVGAESVRQIVEASREAGVRALTLYSFSTENWKRPPLEIGALMKLLKRYLLQERRQILDNGIRLQAIGQLDRLPAFVRAPLKQLSHESRGNSEMVLNLALSYGGRAEIVEAVRAIAHEVKAGRLSPDAIDEQSFPRYLSTANLPDPDLLIRTSGESRLSNFLLWQLAYTELYITDIPWPEFRRPELHAAFVSYSQRQRRFGRTGKQIEQGE